MSETGKERFLNLDDLAPRVLTVQLGGKHYRLSDPDNLGLSGLARLQQFEKHYLGSLKRAAEDPSDIQTALDAENALTDLVQTLLLDLPADEAGKLTLTQKLAVVSFFVEANPALAEKAKAALRVTPPTSETSFPV